ncbi:monofunctional biosynthetic peptidoglycan transglycosylase [Desulfoprunum benzoelyticum]|uniref:Biosynthetic peptidoglycan transglycosylase n=1 Tax=Desulfoprunum benzoelyticum TaxID=1506996 RepID=A0A840UKM0_9BACT|nr:monofunctional biosynthetic peptidoglycan transglycosylase [Desulfoprunum benzoelyticum]MBB5346877.1 monofunctional biosynthetic peptidoglycan transglycosylase [Desulfoprunum benzoelyticum]MBM9529461.1 monofunctional biosynthetic peptidoglycan transglycosylase [Desulfoprunum benzoelyticum]
MARSVPVSSRRRPAAWRRWLRRLVLGFAVLSVVSTIILRVVPPPATPLMMIRGIQGMATGQGFIIRKQWQPLERISPAMVRAVIAAEDQKFLDHSGFDFNAISKAYENNRTGGRQKGGSTITQQTAKNVFLWPGGSYLRKGVEAYFTLLLELCWSKERIIEVYLNVAEFGPGVYGVESAARTYYRTSARRLTNRQAAMLTAILPAPLRWNPARPTGYLMQRQRWILQQMRHIGPLLPP